MLSPRKRGEVRGERVPYQAPLLLIPPRPGQRERLERRDLAVRPDHIVIHDLDRGGAAAHFTWIERECRKAVRMRGVAHRRPWRLLLDINRRALARLRVGLADRRDHPARRRIEEKLVRRHG